MEKYPDDVNVNVLSFFALREGKKSWKWRLKKRATHWKVETGKISLASDDFGAQAAKNLAVGVVALLTGWPFHLLPPLSTVVGAQRRKSISFIACACRGAFGKTESILEEAGQQQQLKKDGIVVVAAMRILNQQRSNNIRPHRCSAKQYVRTWSSDLHRDDREEHGTAHTFPPLPHKADGSSTEENRDCQSEFHPIVGIEAAGE